MNLPVRTLAKRAADLTGVDVAEIYARGVSRRAYRPRFAVVWAVKQINPRLTYQQIGNMFGGRDFSTIRNAYIRAEALREADRNFRNLTDRLTGSLKVDEDFEEPDASPLAQIAPAADPARSRYRLALAKALEGLS